jgi:quercetin dioxygenase-like cupin family protein
MNAKPLLLPALLVLAVALPLHAQDPAKVAPEAYRCTFENEHARLCEVTVKPGAKIPSHSHPQHLVYVLAPGKARIIAVGAAPAEVDFATGQALWIPAETHHAENIGDTEVKLLVIEFKSLKTNPPKADKADQAARTMDEASAPDVPIKDKPKQEAQQE